MILCLLSTCPSHYGLPCFAVQSLSGGLHCGKPKDKYEYQRCLLDTGSSLILETWKLKEKQVKEMAEGAIFRS